MFIRGYFFQLISSYTNVIFAIVNGIILVPLFLKHIPVDIYGTWLAANNIISFSGVFEGGLSIVYNQQLSYQFNEKDIPAYTKTAFSGIVLYSIIFLLMIFIIIIIAPYIELIVKFNSIYISQVRSAFIVAGFAMAISILSSGFLSISKSWHKNEIIAFFNFISSILSIVVTIYSIVVYKLGVLGIGLGLLTKQVVYLLGIVYFTYLNWHKYVSIKPSWCLNSFKLLVVKTLPVFYSNLLSILLNNSKELIIAGLINPASAAIVSITSKLYSLAVITINPLVQSMFNAFAAINKNINLFYSWQKSIINIYNFLILVFFTFIFIFNEKFIKLWVGSQFYGGELLSIILGLNAIFLLKNNLNITLLNAKGKFLPTSIISIIDLLFRVILIAFTLVFFSFELYILPAIELIAVSLSYILLEKISLDNEQSFVKSNFSFILSIIIILLLFTSINMYSNCFLQDFGLVQLLIIKFIMVAFSLLIIIKFNKHYLYSFNLLKSKINYKKHEL